MLDFSEKVKQEIDSYPVKIELPIAWGDMDIVQHINNVAYFRYFESARIQYLDEVGAAEAWEVQNIAPILADTSCRFKQPLTYPDNIIVGAKVVSLEHESLLMEYIVVSKKAKAVAAKGQGRVVFFDNSRMCKVDIPQIVKETVIKIEKMEEQKSAQPA